MGVGATVIVTVIVMGRSWQWQWETWEKWESEGDVLGECLEEAGGGLPFAVGDQQPWVI